MKLGLVITNTDPETVLNVLRLANFAAKEGDEVGVFLLGNGVEMERIEDERFNVREQAEILLKAGGRIMACGTCLKLRDSEGSELCPFSTMEDLYRLIKDADKIVTF
jgi:uncharacterized protein involved in oxidation of intracellular sulfur